MRNKIQNLGGKVHCGQIAANFGSFLCRLRWTHVVIEVEVHPLKYSVHKVQVELFMQRNFVEQSTNVSDPDAPAKARQVCAELGCPREISRIQISSDEFRRVQHVSCCKNLKSCEVARCASKEIHSSWSRWNFVTSEAVQCSWRHVRSHVTSAFGDKKDQKSKDLD
jgi:hypothetical protein